MHASPTADARPEAMGDVPGVCELPLTRAIVQYRDVREPSRYSQGSALTAERIPWRYRSLVKKYFLAIRPDERK